VGGVPHAACALDWDAHTRFFSCFRVRSEPSRRSFLFVVWLCCSVLLGLHNNCGPVCACATPVEVHVSDIQFSFHRGSLESQRP